MPLSQRPRIETVDPNSPEPSPSEKIVKTNRPTRVVVDANGRKITWRPMSILDEAKLLRAVGAEHSKNEPWMNLVRIAASVVNIDGDVGPQITTMSFAEMRIDWVGDDGYIAIYLENQRDTEERIEDAKEAAAKFRDDVKN